MKYKIYYLKSVDEGEPLFDKLRRLRFGFGGTLPVLAELAETHTYLRDIEAEDLEEVFWKMQGEVWSPKGEARELIRSKGLWHTSMSVGDVAEDEDGKFWVVASVGFEEVV